MTTINIYNQSNQSNSINMEVDYVTKRDGTLEEVTFDKILNRIKKLSHGLAVNPTKLTQKVNSQLYPNIHTSEIDELTAQICASLGTEHYDYSIMAGRIVVSNHHKNTSPSFTEVTNILFANGNISEQLKNCVAIHGNKLNDVIDYNRDYEFDYFGFKTLEKSYLMKVNNKIVERPQHLIMRVALGIHNEDIKEALETYECMSKKYFIHATPTLFNAGTPRPQLSSCFLLGMKDDSIDGIFETVKNCANISKWAGGIGLHISNIRAKNSRIRGTNGISNGIVPMLRVFNNTARYVDQGGGKRQGSIAIYLSPWHKDILEFLELRINHGLEEHRARDLFYGLWISDLFMKRVKDNKHWTLFCPNMCKGLDDTYGEKFEELYTKYEADPKYEGKKIDAQSLFLKILESQIETGTPYMCYKDAANIKSNQNNLGTIKSSNLCTEIIEYSSPEEAAVCNLASIGLSRFVDKDKQVFDYEKLHKISKIITKNLNKVIDINYYPIKEAKLSNTLHRPIGIGVQGIADVFAMLNLPFDSGEAKTINRNIFETIYHGALETSLEISKKRGVFIKEIKDLKTKIDANESGALTFDKNKIGEIQTSYKRLVDIYKPIKEELERNTYLGSYSSYIGSPMSKGLFQFDLWNEKVDNSRYNWDDLRTQIKLHGIRNSLLLAPMPTASTSQILGNNECIEPFTSNIYIRRTLAGEFIIINKYLICDLIKLGLWDEGLKNRIIRNNGSVQNIDIIPDNIKQIYKTVWEIGNKTLIDMSADRGVFVCQSQSLNLFMDNPNFNKLSSMHMYAWSKGLKTGMYYLRTKAVAQAQQFTIEPENKASQSQETKTETETEIEDPSQFICRRDDPDCIACSS